MLVKVDEFWSTSRGVTKVWRVDLTIGNSISDPKKAGEKESWFSFSASLSTFGLSDTNLMRLTIGLNFCLCPPSTVDGDCCSPVTFLYCEQPVLMRLSNLSSLQPAGSGYSVFSLPSRPLYYSTNVDLFLQIQATTFSVISLPVSFSAWWSTLLWIHNTAG